MTIMLAPEQENAPRENRKRPKRGQPLKMTIMLAPEQENVSRENRKDLKEDSH